MTELEKKQILVMWQGGMPITRIRQLVAIPTKDFRKGIEEMRKNGCFDEPRETTEQKVCQAFDNGERNVREIAECYGLSPRTVRAYLRKHGRKFGRKTRNYVHSPKTEEIISDLLDGELSQSQIAKNHRVSRQYVAKLNKKLKGLKNNEQRKAD